MEKIKSSCHTKSTQTTNEIESSLMTNHGNLKKYVGVLYLLERKKSALSDKGKMNIFSANFV